MPHAVREFDLARVRRSWSRAIKLHLGLYEGYVKELNALTGNSGRSSAGPAGEPDAWARRFAFEYNGVVLHESFFEALSGAAAPLSRDGALAAALKRSYGGHAAWLADIRELAKVRGIGWIATVASAATGRLHNIWIDQHHLAVPAGAQVLLVLDLWEHAWILDYAPSERGRFVTDLVRQLNWSVIEARFDSLP